MKKNLLLRLFLMMTVLLSLYSCIHDEVYPSSDPSSTGYTNKSLWKQDEKYIRNVMQVYLENEKNIKKINGTPFWDYATTIDTFDESFLMVPIVEKEKVVAVLQVPRKGSNIHFFYSRISEQKLFFQDLIFATYKKAVYQDQFASKSISCNTQWISIWYPADENNPDPESGNGTWGTRSVTVCVEDQDDCISIINEFGECEGGGGGDDPGFPYPGGGTDPEEDEPCEKIKKIGKRSETKNKMVDLRTKSAQVDPATGKYREHSYALTENADGSISEEYKMGELGAHQVNPSITNPIDAYIHCHNPGGFSIFTPYDIASFAFMNMKGKIKNVNTFVLGLVTPQGTQYMLVIDDIASFNTFANKFLNSDMDKTDLLFHFSGVKHGNSPSDNEDGFLQFLSNYSSGLKLMKGDASLNNWTMIERGASFGQKIETPCN